MESFLGLGESLRNTFVEKNRLVSFGTTREAIKEAKLSVKILICCCLFQRPPKTWEKLLASMSLFSTAQIRWISEVLAEFTKVRAKNSFTRDVYCE